MSDVHVLPVNDLREHDETRDCWCQPRCEPDPLAMSVIQLFGLDFDKGGDAVVVHNSMDGRELVEERGVN